MRIKFIVTLSLISFSICAQKSFDDFADKYGIRININNLNQPIHKVAIYDSILWASDYGTGKVFKSTNNGQSFSEIATLGSEYFESIQFLNEEIGFICGDYGFVYKTLDGGETWIEISPKIENRIVNRYRNDSTKNQQPDGQFVAYYSMHFTSKTSGYVSGFRYNPKIGFRGSYRNIFYYTKDGGAIWRLVDASEQEEIANQAKREIATPYGYIGNEYFTEKNLSWRTKRGKNKTDFLIKENYQTNTSDTITLSKNPYQKVVLRSIVFISDKIGFVIGGSLDDGNEKAILYTTKDGGSNWSYMNSKMDHIHVSVKNNKYMFVFGKNGLLKRILISNLLEYLSTSD